MTAQPQPAEVFPVATLINEELEARGWDCGDMAARIPGDNQSQAVNTLRFEFMADVFIWSKHDVAFDAKDAADLATIFGNSAEFWMNIHRAWLKSREPAQPQPSGEPEWRFDSSGIAADALFLLWKHQVVTFWRRDVKSGHTGPDKAAQAAILLRLNSFGPLLEMVNGLVDEFENLAGQVGKDYNSIRDGMERLCEDKSYWEGRADSARAKLKAITAAEPTP